VVLHNHEANVHAILGIRADSIGGLVAGEFFNEILTYAQPHPFVLPGDISRTTGFGPFQKTTKTRYYAIPFDGRYLEEIMWNINKARREVWERPDIQFHSYTPDGRVKESFYPVPHYSYLNDKISIVAFSMIVEDIKAAIEDTVNNTPGSPDSMKAHFGRCFNIAHYRGFPFVSQGLLELYPDMRQQMIDDNNPFYSFPEDITGELMHGAFHNFDYYLPNADNPTRRWLVQAFPKARRMLADGIPMLTRMQGGNWPITQDELITVLNMSIYSKHGDKAKRPAENETWSTDANRYTLTDHKRIFNTFCSFVIQMLRYQVPKLELFNNQHSGKENYWWTSKWFLWREPCSIFWSRQRISEMLNFDSGDWHFCGHGEFDGDGALLNVPPPGRASSLTWFGGSSWSWNIIDQAFAPYLPYGFAPGMWHSRTAIQRPDRVGFWMFHKFQTFEFITEDDVDDYAETGDRGIIVRLSMDLEEMIPARSGGPIRDFAPEYPVPNVVFLSGAPQVNVPIYDEFVNAGTDPELLQRYHNTITGITIMLADDPQYPPDCCYDHSCPWTGSEDYGLSARIKYIGFLDDMVRLPEEFVTD
jgi:hypothetical protein